MPAPWSLLQKVKNLEADNARLNEVNKNLRAENADLVKALREIAAGKAITDVAEVCIRGDGKIIGASVHK